MRMRGTLQHQLSKHVYHNNTKTKLISLKYFLKMGRANKRRSSCASPNSEEKDSTKDCVREPQKKIQKTETEVCEIPRETGCPSPNLADDGLVVIENEDNLDKDNIEAEYLTVVDSINCDEQIEEGEVNEDAAISVIQPCFTISFHDKTVADTYKERILKFVNSFIEFQFECSSDDLTITVNKDNGIDPNGLIVLDDTIGDLPLPLLPETPVSKPQNSSENSTKKRKKRKKKEAEMFVLDETPTKGAQSAGNTKYSSRFQIDDVKKQIVDDSKPLPPISGCFNCGKNHTLRDCDVPKNAARINANKQKRTSSKACRYHLEDDQKYSHLSPGKVSDKLREAMGLRKNQIPPYIYQMRMLGYPPGWLEEAKMVRSDLAMYDEHGNDLKQTGRTSKIQGLNEDKVVEYPGFNVPLEKGYKDEYRQHNTPPYCNDFNKSKMIEVFKNMYLKETDDLESCDMDLDNEKDDKEQTEIVDIVAIKRVEIKAIKNLRETHSNISSPSLTDLEKQKANLLAALDNENSININEESDGNIEKTDSGNEKSDEIIELSDTNDEDKGADIATEISDVLNETIDRSIEIVEAAEKDTQEESIENQTLENDITYPDEAISTPKLSSIKTSMTGTPILKSYSPYAQLPDADNFSKDVSPVICFENLPNSTGKYDQMRDVLKKVQKTMRTMSNKS